MRVAIFLLIPLTLQARAHRFLDKKTVVLVGVNAAAMVLDVVSTRQALKAPSTYEANPAARNMLAVKVAGAAVSIGLSYTMHRAHHYRAERYVPLVMAGPQVAASVHNFRVRGCK